MIIPAVFVLIACVLMAFYALWGLRTEKRSRELDNTVALCIMDLEDAARRPDSPVKTAQTDALTARLLKAYDEQQALREFIEAHNDCMRIFTVFFTLISAALVLAAFLC